MKFAAGKLSLDDVARLHWRGGILGAGAGRHPEGDALVQPYLRGNEIPALPYILVNHPGFFFRDQVAIGLKPARQAAGVLGR